MVPRAQAAARELRGSRALKPPWLTSAEGQLRVGGPPAEIPPKDSVGGAISHTRKIGTPEVQIVSCKIQLESGHDAETK